MPGRCPPKDAAAILRKAGLKRAMVSSSNDDGTQKLHAEAPDIVVPVAAPVSPARRPLHLDPRRQSRLCRGPPRAHRYVAIGEFHLLRRGCRPARARAAWWQLAKRQVFLHPHSDADAIERLFGQDPQARILWAHSGFDRPEQVREMLRKHQNLWCDLAFRSEHGAGGKVDPEWRAAFNEFPDRFMVGTDTFTPERWHYIVEHANWSRAWLADLPQDLAERIAWRNGEALFGTALGQ